MNRDQRFHDRLRLHLSVLFSQQRWKIEGLILFSKIRWVIPCIIIQLIHSIATNIAYYRHVQMNTLKDWGFDTIPALPNDLRWISEFVFSIIFFTILGFGFLPFFHNKPQYYMSTIWIRVLTVLFICIFLRSFSFLATSLPGPAPHCQPYSKNYSPPETIYDIIFRIDITNGCGDLVYSSHTMIAMTMILSAHYYLPFYLKKHKNNNGNGYSYQYKFYLGLMYGFYWPLICLLAILIIAARKHYTVDVIVALYITPLVFHASFTLMKDTQGSEYLKRFGIIIINNNNNSIINSKNRQDITNDDNINMNINILNEKTSSLSMNKNKNKNIDNSGNSSNENNIDNINIQNVDNTRDRTVVMKQRQFGVQNPNNTLSNVNMSGHRMLLNDYERENN